jgi:hypothetical protein
VEGGRRRRDSGVRMEGDGRMREGWRCCRGIGGGGRGFCGIGRLPWTCGFRRIGQRRERSGRGVESGGRARGGEKFDHKNSPLRSF